MSYILKMNNVVVYLPSGISVSVVHEVVSDPRVYGRQCHFVVVCAHRHADQGGVGKRRFPVSTCPVIFCSYWIYIEQISSNYTKILRQFNKFILKSKLSYKTFFTPLTGFQVQCSVHDFYRTVHEWENVSGTTFRCLR